MTATITTNGDNRTITFEYTATIEKIDATLEAAAENIYNEQHVMGPPPVPFANLSNQEKLDLLDGFVKWAVRRKARHFIVHSSISAASDSIYATVDDTII